jgi:hypothetical protein
MSAFMMPFAPTSVESGSCLSCALSNVHIRVLNDSAESRQQPMLDTPRFRDRNTQIVVDTWQSTRSGRRLLRYSTR